jgi:hypothetical protein
MTNITSDSEKYARFYYVLGNKYVYENVDS